MDKTIRGTRITLTKAQCESPSGKRLLDLIFSICHDGCIELSEVVELNRFLCSDTSDISAIPYLRAITRDAIADGSISNAEAYVLKLAFERIVPKEVRGIIATHLHNIGLPAVDASENSEDWREDEASARQIEYIIALGGNVSCDMTKGEASELIEHLLERRPPTPRQVMLLRFFDRLDLLDRTKDEVGAWVDMLFALDARMERAWDRFKRETNHDPYGRDPSIVPIGGCRAFL